MPASKKDRPSPLSGGLFNDIEKLTVVQARFQGHQAMTFDELFSGYESLRVLTYSNSVPIVRRAAELVDDIEIVFGREDLLGRMATFLHYQELLIKELVSEVKGHELIRQKIDSGRMRLYVVVGLISHEKLFLLEGQQGTRVISGSANFSEKAFSGKQNESYLCFDNDPAAWSYYVEKYEKIRGASTSRITPKALLDEQFEFENIPVLSSSDNEGEKPQIILVEDRPPTPNVITKVLLEKTPKRYTDLSSILLPERGVVKISKANASRAIQYIKSNAKMEQESPNEYLTLHPESRRVILSGKELTLTVASEELRNDVRLLVEFFAGYSQFRGNPTKLTRDYFTFMSWFYISPLICDFRNRALARDEYLWDYPLFGILYGKSNCGKSELVRTLMLSMFGQEGFLPNSWLTRTNMVQIREQNKRYPIIFDDLGKDRFKYVVDLIKEDNLSLREYPAVVLSMNAEQDAFPSEVRKRSLIIYTGASLPDHTGESRKLARTVHGLKRNLGTALYREYLSKVFTALDYETPQDILKFSSTILRAIFADNLDGLPAWCRVVSMAEYSETKHDKIKNDLLQLWQHAQSSWSFKGNKATLKLDIHSARKLRKDVPDYMISGGEADVIIFDRNELEEFLGLSLKGGLSQLYRQIRRSFNRKAKRSS